jgi:hypothetical protein
MEQRGNLADEEPLKRRKIDLDQEYNQGAPNDRAVGRGSFEKIPKTTPLAITYIQKKR